MEQFWNLRYSEDGFAYGEQPNVFFAQQINKLQKGSIILPCEGEGRNAVYAASLGWRANALDTSEVGKIKAMALAKKNNVNIDYIIADINSVSYPENSVDVVAFIYAHFAPESRIDIHRKAIGWLKKGGRIILEAFNVLQLQNNSGGPKNISQLYTEKLLLDDFKSLKIELLQTEQTELQEGKYHVGKADIIRFIGVKI